MKFGLKSTFVILITFFSSTIFAEKIVLKRGTFIPVRMTQNVNGNIDSQGDTVYFETLENIKVNGLIAIEKGTFVKGRIVSAEGRKSLGKAGSLALEPRSVLAIDGQVVEFERDRLSSEGRKRTGATVAHVILWGPIGLFAKGRAARIMLDTEYDLEVYSDVTISSSNHNDSDRHHPDGEVNHTNTVDLYFSKYKGKINFAKGKIGKDFFLHINLPKTANLKSSDIEIVEVLNYDLPKNITPTKLYWNQKTNDYVAVFSFRDMVKYIVPGDVDVRVAIHPDHSANLLVGQTTLNTRWKLK